jgi:hypothetical protein
MTGLSPRSYFPSLAAAFSRFLGGEDASPTPPYGHWPPHPPPLDGPGLLGPRWSGDGRRQQPGWLVGWNSHAGYNYGEAVGVCAHPNA